MDGLKAILSFDAVAYDYDDEYLTIDTDTHTININNVSRLFGVQYDGNSKLIKFRIRNKLSDIQKMQDSIVYINWIDSKGVKGQSIAINKTINNDTCEFAWKVPFDALKNSGVLHFAMSAVMTKNSSSVIDQRWSTKIASVITPDGIYIKSYTPSSEEEDRIAQIYNELSNMINKQNDNLQSQVNSLKEDLVNQKKEIDNSKKAISELADKKITKFYASNQGETHITDSDKGLIQDLKIYGQSKQDGEPTPDNPVEIKRVVKPIVKVYGKNMMPYPKDNTVRVNGVTLTAKDGKYTLVGKPTENTWFNIYPQVINFTSSNMLSEKPLPTKGKKISMINGSVGYSLHFRKVSNRDLVFTAKHNTPTLADENSNGVFLYIENTDKTYNDTFEIMISDPSDTTSTVFEPYTEQEVSLPYTLNAIPVSSGGNVTINGQQYIADYVDVEHKKIIRNILKWHLADMLEKSFNNDGKWHIDISSLGIDGSEIGLSNMFKIQNTNYSSPTILEMYVAVDGKAASLNIRGMTDDEFKKWISERNIEIYNVLTSTEEIPITPEEVSAFKQLMTYYPITNITVGSEELDGHAVFNYPISLANGWNYVKKQLNDNRDYIYDMDLQSAEAYVNSEYAVTLTELEV